MPPSPDPALRDPLVWEGRDQISLGHQEIRRARGTRLRKGLGRGTTTGLPLGTQDCRWLLMSWSSHVPYPASESWGIHTDRPRSQTSPPRDFSSGGVDENLSSAP